MTGSSASNPLGPSLEGDQASPPIPLLPSGYARKRLARPGWTLSILLFFATFLSTTLAGLFYATGEGDLLWILGTSFRSPSMLLLGLPFSFTLMGILLAHEMGHYLACRYHGIRCTPPYFIPLPISFIGTLGAFIRIKSPFRDKKVLFDVGVAGPFAGFVFILPALAIGIRYSEIVPKGALEEGIFFGEPLLFRWIAQLVLGYSPATQDMIAHPIAIAAWFGVLATCLNLLPIWQLDGGHIAYAILGRERQRRLSIAATVALVMVSFLGWPMLSYLAFGLLLLIFGARFRFYHPPTLFDEAGLNRRRVILGLLALLVLAVSFTPVPFSIS